MTYFYRKNLKYLREKNNLNFSQIEQKTNIGKVTLYAIETGKSKNPGIETLAPIVKMFGVNYDDFVFADLESKDK